MPMSFKFPVVTVFSLEAAKYSLKQATFLNSGLVSSLNCPVSFKLLIYLSQTSADYYVKSTKPLRTTRYNMTKTKITYKNKLERKIKYINEYVTTIVNTFF